MKARPVKKLDPQRPLADNAARIIRVRLDELCSFVPQVYDPDEVEALHDMRIAAKRLRYILEVTGSCFGPYTKTATKLTKELQDLLGEIHDCDEMTPRVTAHLDTILLADAAALVEKAGDAKDLAPKLVAKAPNLDAYSGLVALLVYLQGRRQLLYQRFLEYWRELQREGFRARLEFALTERSEEQPEDPPEVEEPPVATEPPALVEEATPEAAKEAALAAPPVEPPPAAASEAAATSAASAASDGATPGPDPDASAAAPDAAAKVPAPSRRRSTTPRTTTRRTTRRTPAKPAAAAADAPESGGEDGAAKPAPTRRRPAARRSTNAAPKPSAAEGDGDAAAPQPAPRRRTPRTQRPPSS